MKRILLILYIIYLPSSVFYAQNTLETEVNQLIEKAESYVYNNIDTALFYENQAFELIKVKEAQSPLLINVYHSLGYIYEENNRLQEALDAYKKAMTMVEKTQNTGQKLNIYNDWALIQKKLGKYDITHDYLLRIVTEAEKINDYSMVEIAYNGLGTLYAFLKDYDKAIVNFQKSIEAAEKWGNKEGVILTRQNLSELYLENKKYDLALVNISKTYNMALTLYDTVRIGAILNMYARIESALGLYDNASVKFRKAQNIFEKFGEKPRLAESFLATGESLFRQKLYNEAAVFYQRCLALETYFTPLFAADFFKKLGELYAQQGASEKAIEAFNRSLSEATKLDEKETMRDNHRALASIYSNLGQPQEALSHVLSADQLNEVIFNEKIKKNTNETQLKLDIQRLDMQIEAHKKELQVSFWTRVVLVALLIGVSCLLYYTRRQMKAKQKAQQHAELLMKELHHRVKNNLQTVTSLMRLQGRHVGDAAVSRVLAESRSRLEAISLIHQQLYMSQEVQSINFKFFVEDLIEKMRFTYDMHDKPFVVHIDLDEELINVDLAMPLGLVINELLTNSFKYAYPSVDEAVLTVALSKKRLYYADNGPGLPPNLNIEKTNSFGLQLIISLTNQLRAKYKFGNKNGMYFRMDFKI